MDLSKLRQAYFDATNADDEHNALVLAIHAIETVYFYCGIDEYRFEDLYQEICQWPLSKTAMILCN